MISHHTLYYYLCKFLLRSFSLWAFILCLLSTSLINPHIQGYGIIEWSGFIFSPACFFIIWIYCFLSGIMSARVIVCVCIASDVRWCTNSMCIQLRIPTILCLLLRTCVRVSPARSTLADIRKVSKLKNSICVHFRIPFRYSCRNDVRYHIWT